MASCQLRFEEVSVQLMLCMGYSLQQPFMLALLVSSSEAVVTFLLVINGLAKALGRVCPPNLPQLLADPRRISHLLRVPLPRLRLVLELLPEPNARLRPLHFILDVLHVNTGLLTMQLIHGPCALSCAS